MKLRPFELGLVVVFMGLALLTLILMATYKPAPDKPLEGSLAASGPVVIWGTLPANGINQVLSELAEENEAYEQITYKYYRPQDFDSVLVNALADGIGPDLVLASHEKLVELRRRIQPVSYESFPVRDIRNTYLDGAQIFALSDGFYGYPIAVDPLMMYWNRDIFATEGYLEAPKTWENLVNVIFPDLIQRDFDRTIRRSVVAMGEYGNVRNAFGIISALMIQGGSERVTEDRDGQYVVQLQLTSSGEGDPLRAAADFYTRFSKPSNTLYSWNRSFAEDRQQFVAEDLALYFGYASEGKQIEAINPNLNFDIAEIPQGASATTRRTYAKFYALSLLKSSENKAGAAAVMFDLGGANIAGEIARRNNLVPAFRSLVMLGSNDTYGRVAYQSASIALGWLNPDLVATDNIFKTMTQDINENRNSVGGAASDATTRLRNEY